MRRVVCSTELFEYPCWRRHCQLQKGAYQSWQHSRSRQEKQSDCGESHWRFLWACVLHQLNLLWPELSHMTLPGLGNAVPGWAATSLHCAVEEEHRCLVESQPGLPWILWHLQNTLTWISSLASYHKQCCQHYYPSFRQRNRAAYLEDIQLHNKNRVRVPFLPLTGCMTMERWCDFSGP